MRYVNQSTVLANEIAQLIFHLSQSRTEKAELITEKTAADLPLKLRLAAKKKMIYNANKKASIHSICEIELIPKSSTRYGLKIISGHKSQNGATDSPSRHARLSSVDGQMSGMPLTTKACTSPCRLADYECADGVCYVSK